MRAPRHADLRKMGPKGGKPLSFPPTLIPTSLTSIHSSSTSSPLLSITNPLPKLNTISLHHRHPLKDPKTGRPDPSAPATRKLHGADGLPPLTKHLPFRSPSTPIQAPRCPSSSLTGLKPPPSPCSGHRALPPPLPTEPLGSINNPRSPLDRHNYLSPHHLAGHQSAKPPHLAATDFLHQKPPPKARQHTLFNDFGLANSFKALPNPSATPLGRAIHHRPTPSRSLPAILASLPELGHTFPSTISKASPPSR